MDNEFSQKLFQKLLMFQYCIPGSADNLWLPRSFQRITCRALTTLRPTKLARGISDIRLRSEKKYRTLVMFADSQFQRQVYSHLSCSHTNTLRLLALSGYPLNFNSFSFEYKCFHKFLNKKPDCFLITLAENQDNSGLLFAKV